MSEIAIAIVEHEGCLLIGRRPVAKPLGGLWEFPGGRVEPGESFEEAAQRECLEETGVAVRAVEPYGVVEHAYEHGEVRLHFFVCRPWGPERTPQEPFRWVARGELDQYRFPPANEAVLKQLRSEN